MPAANFKAQFAEKVRTGAKRQTIRRGSRWKVGDRFVAYTGMRSKRCTWLHEGRVTHADVIAIDANSVRVLGNTLTAAELEALARADGFDGAAGFRAFFGPEPFLGQLIRWQ